MKEYFLVAEFAEIRVVVVEEIAFHVFFQRIEKIIVRANIHGDRRERLFPLISARVVLAVAIADLCGHPLQIF